MKPIKSELIKHLTEEQIETLYAEYIQGTKNTDLIEKYNIDVNPNKLFELFPLIEHKDNFCPYCNVSMYSKRKSKSSGKHSFSKIFCLSCKHIDYSDSPNSKFQLCRCIQCNKKRKDSAVKKQLNDQAAIKAFYDLNRFEPIPFDKLTLKQKIFLAALLRTRLSSESGLIEPDDDPGRLNPLTPSAEMDCELLDKLFAERVILVSPDSRFEAFLLDRNSENISFNPDEVHWSINVSGVNESRLDVSECFHMLHENISKVFSLDDREVVFDLLIEVAINEVMNFIEYSSNSYGLPVSAKQKKYDVIKLLLKDLPVRNLFYLGDLAVRNAQLFFDKGLSNGRKHAANTIPGNMLKYGERAKSEGWEIFEFKRTVQNPRSNLSVVLYDLLLNGNDDGFNVVIDDFWKNKLESLDSLSQVDGEVQNVCPSCNSQEVIVKGSSNNVVIQCESCGVISKFRF